MDSGYVAPGDTFDAEFDPASGLDMTKVIWIMDQLLCLEISWHDGYPLSQTVFTSLHIDRLLSPDQENRDPTFYRLARPPSSLSETQSLGHQILRAYCIGLVKCCNLALLLIQSQNYYEEEDFVTHLFGRELLPQVKADQASWILEEAQKRLGEANGISQDVRDALDDRLQFRSKYLNTLVEDGSTYWEDMKSSIESIKNSHNLATPVPDAFSEKVQRQLATSTPPRPMLQVGLHHERQQLKID